MAFILLAIFAAAECDLVIGQTSLTGLAPAAPELRAAHRTLHRVQQLVRVGHLGEVREVFVGVGRGEDSVEAPTRAQLLLRLDQNLDVVGGKVIGDAATPLLPVTNLRVR